MPLTEEGWLAPECEPEVGRRHTAPHPCRTTIPCQPIPHGITPILPHHYTHTMSNQTKPHPQVSRFPDTFHRPLLSTKTLSVQRQNVKISLTRAFVPFNRWAHEHVRLEKGIFSSFPTNKRTNPPFRCLYTCNVVTAQTPLT